jgi:hypothetical protein
MVWVTASSALAQPEVSLAPAADGSLVVVGNGWRPGQRLAVSVGQDVYPIFADSAGGFEVATGQAGPIDQPLRVHRLDIAAPAMARLQYALEFPPDTAPTSAPNPLAVVFAESVLSGAGWGGLVFAGLGAIALVRRLRYV